MSDVASSSSVSLLSEARTHSGRVLMEAPLIAVVFCNSFSKSVTHRVIVHVHVGVLCSSVDGVGRINLTGDILVDSLDFAQGNRRAKRT